MEMIKVSAEQFEDIITRLTQLESKVQELSAPKTSTAVKEMTDADAERILTGDLKEKKHNEAAQITGLSYGQIYSCRGEYTFKHVHKKLKEQGFQNPWKK